MTSLGTLCCVIVSINTARRAPQIQVQMRYCLCRCSGDDAVNICGKAAPVFRACSLRARKCGVRAYERAAPSLVDCKIEACGEQGVKTFEHAALFLSRHAPLSAMPSHSLHPRSVLIHLANSSSTSQNW